MPQSTDKARWTGELPKRCDMCGKELKDGFTDGRTRGGKWAFLCSSGEIPCDLLFGVGYGVGKGQRYDAQGNKVEG